MRGLLNFLYRYRVFIFFVFLEVISFWLLITYNSYYNASFLNSSNRLAAGIQTATSNTVDYAALRKINKELAVENSKLRQQLFQRNIVSGVDTFTFYKVIPSRVVNNNFRRSENYLTIDKGEKSGVLPGTGVISAHGVIGIVKSASNHFATVTSLLHQDLMISSELKRTGTLATTQWDAPDPLVSKLKYLPKHIPLRRGDTIVTSGFNAVFPPGILIGMIKSFSVSEQSAFYDADIELSNDFTSLEYVYVIQYDLRAEKDSVESIP